VLGAGAAAAGCGVHVGYVLDVLDVRGDLLVLLLLVLVRGEVLVAGLVHVLAGGRPGLGLGMGVCLGVRLGLELGLGLHLVLHVCLEVLVGVDRGRLEGHVVLLLLLLVLWTHGLRLWLMQRVVLGR
jgi:hypothetical protein